MSKYLLNHEQDDLLLEVYRAAPNNHKGVVTVETDQGLPVQRFSSHTVAGLQRFGLIVAVPDPSTMAGFYSVSLTAEGQEEARSRIKEADTVIEPKRVEMTDYSGIEFTESQAHLMGNLHEEVMLAGAGYLKVEADHAGSTGCKITTIRSLERRGLIEVFDEGDGTFCVSLMPNGERPAKSVWESRQ